LLLKLLESRTRLFGMARPGCSAHEIDFEPVMDFPSAITVVDAAGQYLLCGLPDGVPVEICAWTGGQSACLSVPPGQSTGVDMTLSDEGG
jgi:hypothetical protein